jgi:hypothetical protein
MNLDAYSPQIIIGACVVVLIVMLAIVWSVVRQRNRRRTAELRTRFGPEYDVAVREYGSRRKAEAALEARLHRIEHIHLRSVTAPERTHFLREWDTVQSRFIDHPRSAVTEADELINNLMQVRGYPGGRFDQRIADISVHHARLADPYRRANAIAVRTASNETRTEELRTAMILYRALFEELLQTRTVVLPRDKAA